MINFTYSDSLYHYGTPRMRWGVRRYQNPDGTLTEEGKRRYRKMSGKVLDKARKADLYRKAGKTRKSDRYTKQALRVMKLMNGELANVSMTELSDVDYSQSLANVANAARLLGKKSREEDYIKKSNKEYRKESEKKLNQISKKKPSELTDEEHDWLDNYVTSTNELYGHSSDVSKEDLDRANELGEKYIYRYYRR